MGLFIMLYNLIIYVGRFLQPFLLLVMRLFWGYGFFMAGSGKFQDMGKIIEFFKSVGIAAPEFNAYLVGTVEILCGILLIVGFASRFAAIPLIITMVTALATFHREAVMSILNNFEAFSMQGPIGYLLTALVVFCFGPGLFSIDAIIKKSREKSEG